MASTKQEQNFKDSVVNDLLDDTIAWIDEHMTPDEVFDERKLFNWAANYSPSRLCSENELEEWALKNGFVKE